MLPRLDQASTTTINHPHAFNSHTHLLRARHHHFPKCLTQPRPASFATAAACCCRRCAAHVALCWRECPSPMRGIRITRRRRSPTVVRSLHPSRPIGSCLHLCGIGLHWHGRELRVCAPRSIDRSLLCMVAWQPAHHNSPPSFAGLFSSRQRLSLLPCFAAALAGDGSGLAFGGTMEG